MRNAARPSLGSFEFLVLNFEFPPPNLERQEKCP